MYILIASRYIYTFTNINRTTSSSSCSRVPSKPIFLKLNVSIMRSKRRLKPEPFRTHAHQRLVAGRPLQTSRCHAALWRRCISSLKRNMGRTQRVGRVDKNWGVAGWAAGLMHACIAESIPRTDLFQLSPVKHQRTPKVLIPKARD